jgi:hypothetical protein
MHIQTTNQTNTTNKKVRFTIPEEKAMLELLGTLPPDAGKGNLPHVKFMTTPQWALLKQTHGDKSIMSALAKRWRERTLHLKPKVELAQPASLNHAYNFCPNCGMKLNP